jgi:NADPH-dependent glutamate synthase beta subunit-like oxidoreductase
MTSSSSAHVVAVVGGATAGAEIAGRLSERGAVVVVFEQNVRPFGKIEDGLPRWHVGLRNKEFQAIAQKLSQPNVYVVPNTRLGRDVDFAELCRSWGFSAVVVAVGAWRDRPLPLAGAERFVGKGLVYQNPFIVWFNHQHDPAYQGEHFHVADGVAVVGGGLASIDVMKLLMLETTRQELQKRGVDVGPLEEFEQRGIPETLKKHGLGFADLGLQGATLYYRRRIEDMPLAEIPADATAERRTKVEGSRRKIVEKAADKYCFRVVPLCAPEELLVEGDRLVGLRFRKCDCLDGKLVPTAETLEHRAPFVVSSIGSIPEPVPGIPMSGELFGFSDKALGRVDGFPNVFSTGNVVTGKGNIVASRKHAVVVSHHIIESFLGIGTDAHQAEAQWADGANETAGVTAANVQRFLDTAEKPHRDTLERILSRVRNRQAMVGYAGNLAGWLEKHPPPADD